MSYATVAGLPRFLSTPALVNLSITVDDWFNSESDEDDDVKKPVTHHRADMVNGLTTFIEQCEPTIHSLRLRELRISLQSLERLLFNLPSVTNLLLSSVTMLSTFFRTTAYASSDDHLRPVLPRLKALRLRHMPDDFPYEDVCNLFAHRAAFHPNHETVKTLMFETFDSEPLERSDLKDAVLKVRKHGVDVHLSPLY
ncbi:hypothetical protein FA13DRAFT_600333 [Coprinellus micaceus]|uniref:F-box domain-containing protein n=1 Tax=Coprinellus micaceus TaxID=71717 RepID=A0A4Y7T8H9_COPMI|nr:hypothetical protein FA13DRAFT_600333 [Coprinellus micaceus]